MPGKQIGIGPFSGGLNTHSDPTAIADGELAFCENFEVDFDGSLRSRPPIEDVLVTMPLPANGNMRLLGYYVAPGNSNYLIGTDGVSSTYYFDGSAWTLITNTFAATDMAQFNQQAWMLAPVGSTAPGGYWSPTSGFVVDNNMPRGTSIVAYKARLWVCQGKDATANNTYIYFSATLGTTPFWPVAPGFVDVGSGDGQNIIKLVAYFGSILIFRDNSIYSYTFGTAPETGLIQLIVPGIGLTDRNCVVTYQRYLYFLHNERVYEFLNNQVVQINQKVALDPGSMAGVYTPYNVSLFNQRIIVSYWSNTYVYSLLTRTWTTWDSTKYGTIGRLVSVPPADGPEQAFLHSSDSVGPGTGRKASLYRITDFAGVVTEQMTCTLRTKNYNYQAPSINKRLYWAGVDAIFRGQMTARAIPVFLLKQMTWGQIRKLTWGQMLSKTWGTLSSDHLIVEEVIQSPGVGAQRKFQKLFGGLFFRQIAFELIFQTDGSSSSAPVRMFSLMTYVNAKDHVVDATS